MADGEESAIGDKDAVLQNQKREKRELQGATEWTRPCNNSDYVQRLRHAQSIPFQLGSTFPAALQQLISIYASSFSCQEQAIIFPLLSVCGSCMGPSCALEVTSDWSEPPILWTVIASSSRTFTQPCQFIDHLQRKIISLRDEIKINPDFILEVFDTKALHDILMNNSGRCLGLFSNFPTVCESINENKMLGHLLFKFFNGGPWIFNVDGQRGITNSTCVSLTGQIDEIKLQNYLYNNSEMSEALRSVFFIITAKTQNCASNLLSAQSQLDLKNVFTSLYNIHSPVYIKYHLRPEAQQLFVRFRSEYLKKSQSECNSLMSEVFQTAPRLLARLALLLHALETVLEAANWGLTPDVMTWSTDIQSETLWSARLLLDYVIEQKRSLMTLYRAQTNLSEPENKVGSSTEVVQINSFKDMPESNLSLREKPANHSPTIVSVSSAGIALEQQPAAGTSNRLNCSLPATYKLPPSTSLSVLSCHAAGQSSEPIEITPDVIPKPYVPHTPEVATPETTSKSYINHINTQSPCTDITQDLMSKSYTTTPSEDVDILEEMSSEEFYKMYKAQLIRILTMKTSSITPSRTVQLKLFRDRPIVQSHYKPKYSSQYARKALYHIEQLGFGILGVVGNGRNVSFQKKRYAELGPDQLKLLKDMCIDEKEYEECFYWRPPVPETMSLEKTFNVLQMPSTSQTQSSSMESDSQPMSDEPEAFVVEIE